MDGEMKTKEESGQDSCPKSAFVVFQCEKCLSIVGDSMAWHSANMSMKTMTLERVTDVVGLKDKIEISRHGLDSGSTYHVVYCKKCDTELGKQYLASCSSMDAARGFITFLAERVTSYQLGSLETSYIGPADHIAAGIQTDIQKKISTLMVLSVSTSKRLTRLELQMFGKDYRASDSISENRSDSVEGQRSEGRDISRPGSDMGCSDRTDNVDVKTANDCQSLDIESGSEVTPEDAGSDHIESISDVEADGSEITSASQTVQNNNSSGRTRYNETRSQSSSVMQLGRMKRDISGDRRQEMQKRRKLGADEDRYESGRLLGDWDDKGGHDGSSETGTTCFSPARHGRTAASRGSGVALSNIPRRNYIKDENSLQARRNGGIKGGIEGDGFTSVAVGKEGHKVGQRGKDVSGGRLRQHRRAMGPRVEYLD